MASNQDRGEDKNVIEAYRDYCSGTAKLKRNIIRLRVGYVCEFYKFAKQQGWIDELPYRYKMRHLHRPAGFQAHTDASGGEVVVPSPMPRKQKSLVKFLTTSEIKSLLHSVAQQVHHQMIIRLALQTGLRREELATFPLAYVIDPDRKGIREHNVPVRLDPQDGTGMKTKGNKERFIYMSTRLMRALHHYAVHRLCRRGIIEEVRGSDDATFPRNPFPGMSKRFKGAKPMPKSQRRALSLDIKTDILPLFSDDIAPTAYQLTCALLVIALRTGRNTAPLLNMGTDNRQRRTEVHIRVPQDEDDPSSDETAHNHLPENRARVDPPQSAKPCSNGMRAHDACQ